MPQIVAFRAKDDFRRDTISVVLSQDAICLSPAGEPWSAVFLDPELARSLAQDLLGLAGEIEKQRQNGPPGACSLPHISSILILHDGSLQSVRAFNLALDFASRSNACMQLVGVYGVHQERCEASQAAEDCIWLERLFEMYAHQAEIGNIELRSAIIAATDEEQMSGILTNGKFDLVVLPRRFSGDEAGEGFGCLRKSLARAVRSSILFCS